MKDNRQKSKFVNFGGKLAMLRKERGLKQSEFGKQFAEFCGYDSPVGVPAISSWEQNRRLPTMENIINITMFFGVSLDYMFGLSDERNNSQKKETVKNSVNHEDYSIQQFEYPNYHGKPVFARFKNNVHADQWGIVDATKGTLICMDFAEKLTPHITLYSYATMSPIRTQITTLEQLHNTTYVRVEMKSSDPVVKALYDGRYEHEKDHKCLVKIGDGTPLSYAGFEVAYWAFKG